MTSEILPAEWEGQLALELDAENDDSASALEQARASIQYLVDQALKYGSSADYVNLIKRVARFHRYSPTNAMLAQLQLPGARYVLPPQTWERRFGRRIKAGAQPIVMLQPYAPVMFVYDVGQTEEGPGAVPLPDAMTQPFGMADLMGAERRLENIVNGAKLDFTRITMAVQGSQRAGCIQRADGYAAQLVQTRTRPRPFMEEVRVYYESVVNSNMSATERLATVAHELGHLYCGHIGTQDKRRWPSRPRLSEDVREVEAESVALLVCQRYEKDIKMPPHLHRHVKQDRPLPRIDLQRVMAAAGRIITMSEGKLPPRPRGGPGG